MQAFDSTRRLNSFSRCSCAVGAYAEADETIPKRSRNLVGAFNDDEAAVSGATASPRDCDGGGAAPLPGQDNSDYQFTSLFDDLRSSAGSDEAEEAMVIAALEVIADFQQPAAKTQAFHARARASAHRTFKQNSASVVHAAVCSCAEQWHCMGAAHRGSRLSLPHAPASPIGRARSR
jgi:hypothetical protein